MKGLGILMVIIACLLVAYVVTEGNGLMQAETARNGNEANVALPAESPAEDTAVARQSEPDRAVISLPGPAARFDWADALADVRDHVEVAFIRRSDDVLLQAKPQDGTTCRYIFGDDGLRKVQVRLTPPDGQTVDQLHGVVMEEMRRKYGHLPDSRRTFWADGFTILELSLNRDLGWVQLEYRRQ